MEQKERFSKVGPQGAVLAADAATWVAVLDNTTGLMWSLQATKVDNWKDAEAAAKKVKAAGFCDWRLPTVEELFALAERTRHDPAIDEGFFPDTASDWFWSSTPWSGSPSGCAWGVFFYGGGACWGGRDYSGFVRAVRVGQS